VTKNPPQVEPATGMLVNLVEVDEILGQLKFQLENREWSSLQSLLNESKKLLEPLLKDENALLTELLFKEKRGFFIKWHQENLMGHEEVLEIENNLYRVTGEEPLREEEVTRKFNISSKKNLFSEEIFKSNPTVKKFEIEHLASHQKTCILATSKS
jgi:hypothetical protein